MNALEPYEDRERQSRLIYVGSFDELLPSEIRFACIVLYPENYIENGIAIELNINIEEDALYQELKELGYVFLDSRKKWFFAGGKQPVILLFKYSAFKKKDLDELFGWIYKQ